MRLLKAGDQVRVKVPRIGECIFTVEEATPLTPQHVVAYNPGAGRLRFEWFGAIGRAPGGAIRPTFHREASTPTPGSEWVHRNGAEYRVLFITNEDRDGDDRPPDVVYELLRHPEERKWSRPLADWARSFTPKQGEQ